MSCGCHADSAKAFGKMSMSLLIWKIIKLCVWKWTLSNFGLSALCQVNLDINLILEIVFEYAPIPSSNTSGVTRSKGSTARKEITTKVARIGNQTSPMTKEICARLFPC
jgi:hypothetical protein